MIASLLLCIAVVSQGVHDVAIEHLGVPYPMLVEAPAWLPVIGDTVRSLFFILFCSAASDRLDRLPLVKAAALAGLLEVCLSETFRVAIIDLQRLERSHLAFRGREPCVAHPSMARAGFRSGPGRTHPAGQRKARDRSAHRDLKRRPYTHHFRPFMIVKTNANLPFVQSDTPTPSAGSFGSMERPELRRSRYSLHIPPNNHRSWRWRFRSGGKEQTLTPATATTSRSPSTRSRRPGA